MVGKKIKQMVGLSEPKPISLERRIESLERKLDFKKTFNTTVIGAFTFVAGLFWRDVATSLIDTFLPKWSGFFGDLFTALLVTIVFVIIAVRANQETKDLEENLDKLKSKKEAKSK